MRTPVRVRLLVKRITLFVVVPITLYFAFTTPLPWPPDYRVHVVKAYACQDVEYVCVEWYWLAHRASVLGILYELIESTWAGYGHFIEHPYITILSVQKDGSTAVQTFATPDRGIFIQPIANGCIMLLSRPTFEKVWDGIKVRNASREEQLAVALIPEGGYTPFITANGWTEADQTLTSSFSPKKGKTVSFTANVGEHQIAVLLSKDQTGFEEWVNVTLDGRNVMKVDRNSLKRFDVNSAQPLN